MSPEYVQKRFHLGVAAVAVVLGIAAIMYLTPLSHHFEGTMFTRIAFALLPAVPAAMGFKRSRETTGGVSIAFMMGANAMLANVAFGVLASFFPHLTDPRRTPAIDAIYIFCIYVPGVIASTVVIAERKSIAYALDGLLATTSLLFVAMNATVVEVLHQFSGNAMATGIALSSPMFDAIMVTVALLGARRGTPVFSRAAVLTFAAAELMDGVNDVAWASHGMSTPMPSVCVFFWTAHCLLLLLCFLMPQTDNSAVERPPSLAYILFPYLPPLMAGVVAARILVLHQSLNIAAGVMGGIVLASLMARQLIAVLEHARMGNYLEKKVDELRARELELEHLSMHDPLTALPNRRYLTHRVEESPQTDEDFVVLLIDLDDFKNINDSLGHDAGDALLCYVADILRASVRSKDFVARLGGDEFAVLLEGTSVELATPIGERIVNALKATFEFSGHPVNVGSSIGLASGHGLENFDNILRQADMAMYERKRSTTKGGLAVFVS